MRLSLFPDIEVNENLDTDAGAEQAELAFELGAEP